MPGRITTGGGWTEDGLNKMADDTGRHWFNFAACVHPDLDIVIVTINGTDHNNYRHNNLMAVRC